WDAWARQAILPTGFCISIRHRSSPARSCMSMAGKAPVTRRAACKSTGRSSADWDVGERLCQSSRPIALALDAAGHEMNARPQVCVPSGHDMHGLDYSARHARYWRRNLAVCVFGSFTTLVSLSMLLPFLPIYVQQLGVQSQS